MELGEKLLRVRSLSNEGLLLGLEHSLRVSRRAVAEVVAYLGEVEERRLHLLGGYSSMFAYCSQRLGMSEDEAYRRIEVACLCRRFPRLFELLAEGGVSLSVAALLKARLTDVNHEALLGAVSGKTVAQAREVLAAWFPQPDVAPLLRKLPARASSAPAAQEAAAASSPPGHGVTNSASAPAPTVPRTEDLSLAPASKPSTSRNLEPLSPERYKLQLTVSSELKGKLELVRDLLRHAVPSGDLATLLERALDALLEQSTKRRFARAVAAARSIETPADPTEPAPVDVKAAPSAAKPSAARPSTTVSSAPSRHIPNPVRREVHARDDGRCTWQGPDGVRCNSRAWLEHDHVIPRGCGGTHEATNIREYCRPHNRLAAEQVYGKETIARIVTRKRRQRASGRHSTIGCHGRESRPRVPPNGPLFG